MKAPEPGLPPRLSEAAHLLPLISGHLDAAAWDNPYCASLQLVPIVDDGLFGYELVPDLDTHTYVIIGRNAQSRPSLRTVSYSGGDPGALQLIAVQGRLLSRSERASRYSVQSRDAVFADWHAAANAACAQLRMLFPQPDDERSDNSRYAHRHLEEALRVAHAHLDRFDPFIEFFGLPNEAQLGFPLSGASGEQGELAFREPDAWVLHWRARGEVLAKSWSIGTQPAAGTRTRYDRRSLPDRRVHHRRATDRGEASKACSGEERRRTQGRRARDRNN
jgi:hypothetical protein